MMRLLAIVAALLPLAAGAQVVDADGVPWTRTVAAHPLTGVGSYPQLDTGHFMRCRVNPAGDDWVCTLTSDGSDVAVTAGAGGMNFADCFGKTNGCLSVTAANEAPYIAAATAQAVGLDSLLVSNDMTVRVVFFDASGATNRRVFSMGVVNTDGFDVWSSPTQGVCVSNYSGGRVTVAATNAQQLGWNVVTCTNAGTASRYSRANGTIEAEDTTSITMVAPTDSAFFGAYTGPNFNVVGYIYLVDFYSAVQTDAQSAVYESQLWGVPSVAIDRDSATWCPTDATRTTFDALGSDWPCVSATNGLFVSEGRTNYAQESITLDSMATTGTVTVTPDQASGPYSTYAVGAEAESIDSTAADLGCVETASAGTADGSYTCSVDLATADQTGYTIEIFKDGTGLGTALTGNDLTASFVHLSTSQATGGAASTDITCRICSGDAAADTGEILASGVHFWKSAHDLPPCLSTASATATCAADQPTEPSTGWPAAQGSIDFVYTPGIDGDPVATIYLLDSRDSGNGVSIYIDTSGDLYATSGDGTNTTTTTPVTNPTWADGTEHRIRLVWGSDAVLVYLDGTLAASAAGQYVPTAHVAAVGICSTAAGASQCNGSVKLQEVRR